MPEGAEYVWNAFWALQGDRTMAVHGFGGGMGGMVIEAVPRPLSWRAIADYAEWYGIEGMDFDRFLILVGALDQEFMEIMEERRLARWEAATASR